MSITNKIAIKVKISDLKSYGRSEITTKEELLEFPRGSLISYTNKQGFFQKGGYLCKVKDQWFIFIGIDCKQKIRVRYCNVDKIYVGDVFKVTGDTISFNNDVTKKTKYPVTIGNHVVYYASSSHLAKRFMVTNKYENMLTWYNYFHSNNE